MRVFRPTYKDREGATREASRWAIEFRDAVGRATKARRDLGASAREANHRLQACKEFTRWAVASGLLSVDPLARLRPLNARLDPRHVRRALRYEELRALVQAAHDGPEFR